jgi:hypothetical protein
LKFATEKSEKLKLKMKLVFFFGLLLFNAAVNSDLAADITAEAEALNAQLALEIQTSMNATITDYVNQGVTFAAGNEIFRKSVIGFLSRCQRGHQAMNGRKLLVTYTENQDNLNNFFTYDTMYSILSNFDGIRMYFEEQIREKVSTFVATASDEAEMQNCWDSNKDQISNFVNNFTSTISSIFSAGPSSISEQLNTISTQRTAIFQSYVDFIAKNRNSTLTINRFVRFATKNTVIV